MNDTDNWSIDNESFNIITNKYGAFSVDRFANNLNKKLKSLTQNIFVREHPTLMHLLTIIDFSPRYRALVLC